MEPVLSTNWLRLHAWPIGGMLAILITGMAYSFWWYPVVHHVPFWGAPSDLWGTFRTAELTTWNGEGFIYTKELGNTGLVTFPGITLFLTPVAVLSNTLHLTDAFAALVPHPTTWLILGPAEFILGGVLLFPLDALARRLSVTPRRRILLVWIEAALIWPTLAIWGHPEDALALAFAVYGLMAAFDRSWIRVGALFGLAIVVQPLTILILPIALAYVPARRWAPLIGEAALPSVMLLLTPLIQRWGPTTYALLKQPNLALLNHPTPWLPLAPVLRSQRYEVVKTLIPITHPDGHRSVAVVPTKVLVGSLVAAGPGRFIATILAIAIGVWVARRKPSTSQVAWLAALALSLRCVFESVMDPYYLFPGLAVVLVVAAGAKNGRFGFTVLAAAACTWLSYRHTGPWEYYLPVTGFLFLTLALAWPGSSTAPQAENLSAAQEDSPGFTFARASVQASVPTRTQDQTD